MIIRFFSSLRGGRPSRRPTKQSHKTAKIPPPKNYLIDGIASSLLWGRSSQRRLKKLKVFTLMSKLIVIIPAYNEEKTIANVIREIPRKICGISEVLVL
ncbi:hypothetical protein COT68_01415, partial [bacterium (Candidatus Torokbacteria) CG09_land_8_20_14_0_10_42_11]